MSHRRRARVFCLVLAVTPVAALLIAGCGGKKEAAPKAAPRPLPPSTQPDRDIPTTSPTTQGTTQAATQPTTRPEEEPTTQAAVPTTTAPADDAGPSIMESMPSTLPVATDEGEPLPEVTDEPDEPDAEPPPSRGNDLANLPPSPGPTAQMVADALERLASGTLRQQAISPLLARQAEAVLSAAVRLAPDNARLARQLVDARLAAADPQATLEALDHYRGLDPDDRLAQLRYVDLSADLLESADLKLNYLTRVVDSSGVPAEVRAHAAVLASGLLRERLEDTAADEMVRRAVELDEFNPRALELDYSLALATGADRPERVARLAKLLRANVAQPTALSVMARELGAAGLIDEALRFYNAADRAFAGAGVQPPISVTSDRVAALLIAGRSRDAVDTSRVIAELNTAAAANPESSTDDPAAVAEASIVSMLALSQVAGRDVIEAGARGENARIAYLLDVGRFLAGELDELPALPEPRDDLPDLGDAGQLAETDAIVRSDLVGAMYTRAWIDLVPLAQPTEPRLLEAIRQLVPESSTLPAWLDGMQAWRQGNAQLAREKFDAVAEVDPLARLGLLQLRRDTGEEEEAVVAEAEALLREYPAGLIGASVAVAFAEEGVTLRPDAESRRVAEAAAAFEERLFGLLDPSRIRDFYALSAQPDRVRVAVGQPIIARVTLRNVGRDTLTLGPGGVLSPIVRLDAEVKGILEQRIPAANTGSLGGRTRLEPGDRVEQEIRLDGPELAALLQQNPQLTLTLFANAATNPQTVAVPSPENPEETVYGHVVGPAGQVVEFARVMDRPGLPLDLQDPEILADLERRIGDLRDADPQRRLRAAREMVAQLNWLAGHITRVEQNGDAERANAWRQLGGQMADALRRAALSTRPAESTGDGAIADAWLRYSAASITADSERPSLLRPLLASPEMGVRVIGLLAASQYLPAEAAGAMAASLSRDEDPTVRRLANATAAYAQANPAPAAAE